MQEGVDHLYQPGADDPIRLTRVFTPCPPDVART
jgi:hypothetical protein